MVILVYTREYQLLIVSIIGNHIFSIQQLSSLGALSSKYMQSKNKQIIQNY